MTTSDINTQDTIQLDRQSLIASLEAANKACSSVLYSSDGIMGIAQSLFDGGAGEPLPLAIEQLAKRIKEELEVVTDSIWELKRKAESDSSKLSIEQMRAAIPSATDEELDSMFLDFIKDLDTSELIEVRSIMQDCINKKSGDKSTPQKPEQELCDQSEEVRDLRSQLSSIANWAHSAKETFDGIEGTLGSSGEDSQFECGKAMVAKIGCLADGFDGYQELGSAEAWFEHYSLTAEQMANDFAFDENGRLELVKSIVEPDSDTKTDETEKLNSNTKLAAYDKVTMTLNHLEAITDLGSCDEVPYDSMSKNRVSQLFFMCLQLITQCRDDLDTYRSLESASSGVAS